MLTGILLYVPLMVAGALSFALLFLDADRKWKILCPLVVLACLAMRAVPWIEFPFLLPFLLESAVALGLSIWLKIEYW